MEDNYYYTGNNIGGNLDMVIKYAIEPFSISLSCGNPSSGVYPYRVRVIIDLTSPSWRT